MKKNERTCKEKKKHREKSRTAMAMSMTAKVDRCGKNGTAGRKEWQNGWDAEWMVCRRRMKHTLQKRARQSMRTINLDTSKLGGRQHQKVGESWSKTRVRAPWNETDSGREPQWRVKTIFSHPHRRHDKIPQTRNHDRSDLPQTTLPRARSIRTPLVQVLPPLAHLGRAG